VSYVVSVQRDAPITGHELHSIAENDPEYSLSDISGDDSAPTFELTWQPDNQAKPVSFVLHDGTIDVSTPSDFTLRKMQSLAKLLDANVVGEEGEDLTTTEVVDVPSQGCGPIVWAVALVVAFLIGYWVLN
jgi:hypothetical protein